MKKKMQTLCLALLIGCSGFAQFQMTDTISKSGFTLVFINKDSAFSKETKQKMIDAFFAVYPQQVKRFNQTAQKKVVFIIDPAYTGVAATSGGVVRYNPKWMKDHPEDIDVVTHEAMHIVQDYGRGGGPGWLTEGIADYVRYAYGVNNINGKWILYDYKEGQSYQNSYRITARFLVWCEQAGFTTLVDQLDKASRDHVYTPEIWKKVTGKTLDELWSDYTSNPAVKLTYH